MGERSGGSSEELRFVNPKIGEIITLPAGVTIIPDPGALRRNLDL